VGVYWHEEEEEEEEEKEEEEGRPQIMQSE
jgi:hypothetical protein